MLFKKTKPQLEHLNRKIDALYDYLGLEYFEEGEIHKGKILTVTIKESRARLKDGKSPTFVVLGGKNIGTKKNKLK